MLLYAHILDRFIHIIMDEIKYISYSIRWIVQIGFMCLGYSVQSQYMLFISVNAETREFFGISALEANLLPMMFAFVHAVGSLPICKLTNQIGIRLGLMISSGLNFIATLLRYISILYFPNLAILLICQFLSGISVILVTGYAPLIAATWFPVHQRTISTALSLISASIGVAITLLSSPYILKSVSCEIPPWVYTSNLNRVDQQNKTSFYFTPQLRSNCGYGFSILCFIQLIISVVPFVVFSTVPGKPPTPPSATASHVDNQWKDMKTVILKILSNNNFTKFLILFAMNNGMLSALSTVLPQFMGPVGITEKETASLAFSGILAGAVNAVLTGKFVDCYRKYKTPWIVYMLCLMFTLILQPFIYKIKILMYIDAILMLMFAIPLLPLLLEFGCELTYPAPENIVGTLLIIANSISQVVFMFCFSFILGNHPQYNETFKCLILIIVLLFLYSFSAHCFVKEDLRRYDKEQSMGKAQDEDIGYSNQCIGVN